MLKSAPTCKVATSQQGLLATRIGSLGALGEGSDWDLRVRPAPAPAASGNLEILSCGGLEIQKSGIQQITKNKKSQNPNPFCPTCRQGLD